MEGGAGYGEKNCVIWKVGQVMITKIGSVMWNVG